MISFWQVFISFVNRSISSAYQTQKPWNYYILFIYRQYAFVSIHANSHPLRTLKFDKQTCNIFHYVFMLVLKIWLTRFKRESIKLITSKGCQKLSWVVTLEHLLLWRSLAGLWVSWKILKGFSPGKPVIFVMQISIQKITLFSPLPPPPTYIICTVFENKPIVWKEFWANTLILYRPRPFFLGGGGGRFHRIIIS